VKDWVSDWALLVSLLIGLAFHEAAHAFASDLMGDDGPRAAGRCTLNPLRQLHPVGSFIVPVLLCLVTAGSFLIAWAKPVNIDVDSYADWRVGLAVVSSAGPGTNLALGVAAAVVVRLVPVGPLASGVLTLFGLVNLFLGFFNLIPVPPLDGSKIVAALLPDWANYWYIGHGEWVLGAVFCGWVFVRVLFDFDLVGAAAMAPAIGLFDMCLGR